MTTPFSEKPGAMLGKVRALLAKAEAEGVTPAEAEALTAKAAELMARYGIDKAMAAAKGDTSERPGNRIFDISNPWGQIRAHLLAGIAGALGCQCVLLNVSQTTRAKGIDARVHVFGYAADIEQVDVLYTSLILQMANAHKRVRVPEGARSVRAWNRSWLLGWVTAVITRCKDAYARAAEQADAERTSGPSTALVLADRSVAIKALVGEAYPVTRRTRITYSGRGYSDGYAKGQKANIHDKQGVGTGGRALAR